MTDSVELVKNANPNIELGKLVGELRETLEKENKTFGETQEKISKMEKDLAVYEKLNQEIQGKMLAQQKVIDALEKHAGNASSLKADDGSEILNPELVDVYYKTFEVGNLRNALSTDPQMQKYYVLDDNEFITLPAISHKRRGNITREMKYLRTDVADAGGLLVPPEFIPTMLRNLTEISPIRQVAGTRTTYSNLAQIPLRNVLLNSYWGFETQTPLLKSQSQYNRIEIPMKRLHVQVPITIEELMDSPIDMQAEITNDVNEEFARKEGYGFIKGNNDKEIEGLMTNADIKTINSGESTDITADAIIKMFGEIKWQSYGNQKYDRIYAFNRRTWIEILLLKDGVGRYIWNMGNIAAGIPNTILGANYIIAPDMDDIGAGNYPILMGDFKAGYMIVDRMLMYMVRDELTTPGIINFSFIRRLGAKVTKPEAFVKMKISV